MFVDEILNDTYPTIEIDAVVYERDWKMVVMKTSIHVDLGVPTSVGEEEIDDNAVQVIKTVHDFNLRQTTFDK